MGPRNVQRPNSSAAHIPARVRSDRTSLSNCAKGASTPSINLPVEVSSIGSVADRNEMPSDFRCDRSAKLKRLRYIIVKTCCNRKPLKH